jgi:hypothetical protein
MIKIAVNPGCIEIQDGTIFFQIKVKGIVCQPGFSFSGTIQ